MTRYDIIRMAQESGLAIAYAECDEDDWQELERFAALVAAAEREACAKVCEEATLKNWFAEDCVALIRERNDL